MIAGPQDRELRSHVRIEPRIHLIDLNSARHEENGQPHVKLSFYCSFQTTEDVDHASVSAGLDASL